MDTWTIQELAEVLGIVDTKGEIKSKEKKELGPKQIVLWKTERIYAIQARFERHGFMVDVNESKPYPKRTHADRDERIYVEGISKPAPPKAATTTKKATTKKSTPVETKK